MRLIGLSGYARAGKDEIGKVLATQGYQRESFADTLRAFLLAVDPVVYVPQMTEYGSLSGLINGGPGWGGIGWERAKDEVPMVRELLQRTGTEAGRQIIGDNVWIDATFRRLAPNDSYVFTDVRFPNEADAIRNAGGQVWRVMRPGTGPVNNHPSETALDDYPFDVTLVNNGTLEMLRSNVIELLAMRAA